MIPDYHIHTKFSRDAKGEVEDFLKTATTRKISEIGFSEHLFFNYSHNFLIKNNIAMLLNELKSYIKFIHGIRKKSPISIKIGCEIEFSPEFLDKIKKTLNEFNFDYTIVSSDSIGSLAIPNEQWWKRYKIKYIYRRYFRVLQTAINSGLFDIVGHIDHLKKYGFRFDKEYHELMRETIEIIKEKNMCIEVNTSGLDKCKEQYPNKKILKLCFDLGIPITLGSDAHNPNEVGRYFKEIINLLKSIGYDKIAVFKGRKRNFIEI